MPNRSATERPVTYNDTNLNFTVSPHVAWPTVAVVVVDELYAVLRTWARTGIGQTLIDVSLTARANKAGWTATVETAHTVYAGTVVVARPRDAVVYVDLTDNSKGSCTPWQDTLSVVFSYFIIFTF